MLNPADYLQNCQVEIWSQQFAVVKSKYVPDDFVAVFHEDRKSTRLNSSHRCISYAVFCLKKKKKIKKTKK